MPLVWRALTIALLFSLSIIVGVADTRIDTWLAVPPRLSGLVLIINAPVDLVTISSGKDQTQESIKWNQKAPTFIRQIRMEPGDYQLRLQGPIPSLNVVTKEGSLSYIRLGRYENTKDNESGVYAVAITGTAREALSALENAAKIGIPDVYGTTLLKPGNNNIIVVNTEPPWPIPPQPPPKQ